MAIAYVGAASGYVYSSQTSVAISQISGIQNNDIMFALCTKGSTGDFFSVPSNWIPVASSAYSTYKRYLYYKIANNESGTYVWDMTTQYTRLRIDVGAWRGGFNISNPIDNYSNTAYTTSDTTVRAESFNVAASGSALLYFGSAYNSSSVTYTVPSNPGTFSEDMDQGDTTSDFWHTFARYTWASNGSTGNIDGTISTSLANKHAFVVSLNPSININKINNVAYGSVSKINGINYSSIAKINGITK